LLDLPARADEGQWPPHQMPELKATLERLSASPFRSIN
jgi:hypothetical protein